MKKFLSAAIVALVVALSAHCSADSVTELKWILGNWYDAKGNLVLSISNDYKINGCTVLSVKAGYDTAALYEIRINEGTGYRDITLCTDGSDQHGNPEGNHEWLVLNWRTNKEITLRKSKNPRYFESVGGIYLGMHKDDVVKLYGQPLRVEKTGKWFGDTWHYRGFDLGIKGEVVYKITIYKNSDRRFDWSGLSANDSLQSFFTKYNTTRHRKGSIAIGHGEVIVLEGNTASLVCFTPGYVL